MSSTVGVSVDFTAINAIMAVLSFTLSEEGVAAFRDALICLNKFSDDVSMEARKDSVGPFTPPDPESD